MNVQSSKMAASTTVDFENLYQRQDSPGGASSTQPLTPPPSYGDVPGVVPVRSIPGPPPSYDEASNPHAPPPSYESLFGRVKEARKNSSGIFDFFKKLFILILGTIGCTIIVGLTAVIPISMIVIGSIHMYDCPAEPYIPIYLVVGGIFGVIKNIINCRLRCKKHDDTDEEALRPSSLDTVMNCFLFAWFIAGCVWIYRIYEPNYTIPGAKDYCDRTLYLFSFWLITAAYIVLCFIMMCLCCIGVAALAIKPD